MGRKTVSLDAATYALLKASKRPGESFSDVIRRLLAREEPSLSVFRHLFDREAAEELAEVVRRMREEDLESAR